MCAEKSGQWKDGRSIMVANAPQRRTPKLGCDADYALERLAMQAPTDMLIGSFPHDAAQKNYCAG